MKVPYIWIYGLCLLGFHGQATSPQTGEQTGGSLKSMKEKSGQQEKDVQEGSALKTAGPAGEIIAGMSIISMKNVTFDLKSFSFS